jgi:hypothetical protein
MKQFISLLISFEVLITPIAPSLRLITSEATVAQSNYCPEGQYFDNTRGRCLITQENAQSLNNAKICDDPNKTQTQREDCYRELAEATRNEGLRDANGNLIEKPSTSDGMQFANEFFKGAAIAVPMILAIEMIKNQGAGSSCTAASFIALVAGAVTLFGVEIGANYAHGVRLNKIQESWDDLISNDQHNETDLDKRRENSTKAQQQAFYKLAEMERSLATTLMWKSIANGVASVAFFTAMGIAIAEQFAIGAGDTSSICLSDKQKLEADVANAQKEADLAKQNYETLADQGRFNDGKSIERADALIEQVKAEDKLKAAQDALQNFTPKKFEETPRKGSLKEAIEFSFHDWDEEIIKMKNIENIKSAKDFRSYYTLINGVDKKYSSPSLDEYEEMKEKIRDESNFDESEEFLQTMKNVTISIIKGINPIQDVMANEGQDQIDYTHFTWITLGAGALVGGLLATLGPVRESLISPPGRIIVGSVLGVWAGIMTVYNLFKMNDANKRAEILEQIGDDFVAASGGIFTCQETDRNNPVKPECYCFTAEGPRNTNRINSQVCQAYFGVSPDLIASNYQSSSSSAGCIDANKQPDPKCTCKNSSKKCMSVSPKNVGNLDLGSFKMLGNSMKQVNQLANGSLDSAKVSSSSLANQAARIRKRNEQILKNPKLKNLSKKVALGEKKLEKILTNAASKLPPPRNEARSIPSNPKAAIAALEKDLKEAKEQFKELQVAPGVNPGGSGGGEKEPGLDFGLSAEDLEAQKGDLAKAMNQKLDYGQNDISASDGNIFQVLSNRYMRSGMRRLFDEEGKLEAEKPAESDINK